jgi:hypothetical protein
LEEIKEARMTVRFRAPNKDKSSARLIIGALMIFISLILAVVFYFQTELLSNRDTDDFVRENTIAINPPELYSPETEKERLERLRQAALFEIHTMRRDAAIDFQKLAATHEQTARIAIRNTIIDSIDEARGRVPGYAEWMISGEATFDMAKALWNESLEVFLIDAAKERLISDATLGNRLEQVSVKLSYDAATEAENIAMHYENRFATLLAGMEEPVKMQMPTVEFISITEARIGNPVITGNVMGMTSFIGSAFILSFAAEKFIKRLGKQITIKAGSKIVRVGSGPVGWVIGLAGGYLVEKGVDEYYVKPHLEKELNQQLDQIQAMLLGHDFIEEAAHAQALPIHNIAKALKQPITMAAASQQEQNSHLYEKEGI